MTAYPWEQRMSRLEGAFEQVVERLGDMSARLETLEIKVDGNYHALDAKLSTLDAKFESKFTTMDANFESKFKTIDATVDSKFRFLVGLYVSSTLTIVVAVLATVLPLYSRLPPLH